MAERGLVLGTAGHIDHGKTALVEALTGKNTDRLAEERRRGISIELGFAELRLPDGASLSVVDVPGHERLVRTMVAGASGIDLFLMVVAADDGVMPQTREHWTVLRTLGVDRGVIALTKCDLATEEARRRARLQVSELMPEHPLVEVSGPVGAGLAEAREALSEVARESERGLAAIAGAPATGWPESAVLHLDRVFSIRGAGTVVTGTLWSGEICRGDRLEVQPKGLEVRVRTIHIHDHEVESAGAGRRVALNLAGIDRAELVRGDVVASPGAGLSPTYRLDCHLLLAADVGVRAGERLQVHHGTRDAPARIVPLDAEGQAQLRLEEPLVARAGDRIVLRRIAPPGTLGGGVIVDAHPRRHGPARGNELVRVVREGNPEALLAAALQEARQGVPRSPAAWGPIPVLGAARTRFSPEDWAEAIERLLGRGGAQARGRQLALPDRAHSTSKPGERPGDELPLSEIASMALELLREDGPRPRAPQDLARALKTTREEAIAGLEELVRAGRAVRLKPDVYYERETLEVLAEEVVRVTRERGSISLAELRDELRTSRKYAQALLERLDGEHLLIRRGDRHFPRRFG